MKTFKDIANPWIKDLAVYEPGRPIEEVAREMGFEDIDSVIKLASNENALGPSPLAIKAMKAEARRMHYYPDGGAFYFKQAMAEKLGVSPGMIVPGTGSNELIVLLSQIFLGKGTGIVMADRAFVVYKLIARAFQADVVTVPMKDFTHDLPAMLAAIRQDTRIVYISNPNNPTGTAVSRESLEDFMSRVPDHVIVCLDEAYIELLPPAEQPDTLRYVKENRNVVVLRTFSKLYGLAGLRLGYAVASPECVQLIDRVRQPFNVNAMAMVAAIAALKDEKFVAKTRRLVKSGLAFYKREFRRMGLKFVPSCANFVLVETGTGRQVFQEMQKGGVIVRPMDGYGLPDHVRITIGKPAENKRCIEVLQKVLASRKQQGSI